MAMRLRGLIPPHHMWVLEELEDRGEVDFLRMACTITNVGRVTVPLPGARLVAIHSGGYCQAPGPTWYW